MYSIFIFRFCIYTISIYIEDIYTSQHYSELLVPILDLSEGILFQLCVLLS